MEYSSWKTNNGMDETLKQFYSKIIQLFKKKGNSLALTERPRRGLHLSGHG